MSFRTLHFDIAVEGDFHLFVEGFLGNEEGWLFLKRDVYVLALLRGMNLV